MNDERLVANYSFAEGEHISEMDLYYGVGIDGFTMTTNVQTYPHIRGTGGFQHTAATGQQLLFVSGEVHEYMGNHQIARLRFYFDACWAIIITTRTVLIDMYKVYVYIFVPSMPPILSPRCARSLNAYAPRLLHLVVPIPSSTPLGYLRSVVFVAQQ